MTIAGRLLCLSSLAVVFGTHTVAASAATEPEPFPQITAETPLGGTDEVFIDGVIAGVLAEQKSPGAAVAVVRNGRVRLVKGYGYADVGGTQRVNEDTLFRVGSISKVFVWLAVLQQVEAGRIDLDGDVNDYLRSLRIPDESRAGAGLPPVTIRHLMTHAAGFDDRLFGLFSLQPPESLGERLAARIPARLWPPNARRAYSNWGTALAAHVVETASGLSWEDYARRYLFRPLDQKSISFRQPLDNDLAVNAARGYRRQGGIWKPQDFEYVSLPPAGALSASAAAIAELAVELARPDRTRVFNSVAAKHLLYQTNPDFDAGPGFRVTHGLYDMSRGSVPALGHGGATMLFHSRLVVWPETRAALFVSMNAAESALVIDAVVAAVAQHWGYQQTNQRPPITHDGARFAGYYAAARASHEGPDRLLGLASGVDVTTDPVNGDLLLRRAMPPGLVRMHAVDGLVFEEVQGWRRAQFIESGGNVVGLRFNSVPVIEYFRADHPRRLGLAALAIVFVNVAVWVAWPWTWLFNRREPRGAGQWRATLVAMAVSALLLGFAFWWLNALADPTELLIDGYRALDWLLWIPVAAAALLVVQLALLVKVWRTPFWWFARRLHYTALTVANGAFLGWCWLWNLHPEGLIA